MFTRNKRVLASLAAIFSVGLVPGSAWAQAAGGGSSQVGATIGASLAIGLAVLGATARIQTPMIIGLALIESLVLFAFAIAFLLQSKAAGG